MKGMAAQSAVNMMNLERGLYGKKPGTCNPSADIPISIMKNLMKEIQFSSLN
jgi:hypothetical protein